ncbi:hypothetical protein WMY93_003690 [Mugilogobius chulae]|uniref:Secreted protein n=1 Tax=Mugilogobius chulae TaxID=88201 RepID=A0AAW0Q867_9GOBI
MAPGRSVLGAAVLSCLSGGVSRKSQPAKKRTHVSRSLHFTLLSPQALDSLVLCYDSVTVKPRAGRLSGAGSDIPEKKCPLLSPKSVAAVSHSSTNLPIELLYLRTFGVWQ